MESVRSRCFHLRWTGVGLAAQGTVEYALVTGTLVAILIGLGALWHLWDQGLVVTHALQAASHSVGASLGGLADVFCY